LRKERDALAASDANSRAELSSIEGMNEELLSTVMKLRAEIRRLSPKSQTKAGRASKAGARR